IITVRIVRLIRDTYPPRTDEAVVLGLFVLLVVGFLWTLQRWVGSRQRHATIGGKVTSGSRIKLGAFRRPARVLMLGYLGAASVLPLGARGLAAVHPYWPAEPASSALTLDTSADVFSSSGRMRSALVNSVSLGVMGASAGILLAAVLMLYVQS